MEEVFEEELTKLLELVVNDSRWDLNNELLFQVLGFTVVGFSYGVGVVQCNMVVEKVADSVISKLINLGAGEKYVRGLVDAALDTFVNKTKSLKSDLVGVGFSNSPAIDVVKVKELIYSNTSIIEQSMGEENS